MRLIPYEHHGYRGLAFTDVNGNSCSVQESSAVTDNKTYLWVGRNATRMHLTREEVAQLLPVLAHFCAEGRLP
jgi:hypothetical protein